METIFQNELWLPFLMGLFPSLITVIPTIINTVKSIRNKVNFQVLDQAVTNLHLGSVNIKEDGKKLMQEVVSNFNVIKQDLVEVTSIAKDSILKDVQNITQDVTEKMKQAEGMFHTLQEETKTYLNSMKNQIMSEIGKELSQLVNNVLKVQEEGQSEVSDK